MVWVIFALTKISTCFTSLPLAIFRIDVIMSILFL